MGKKGWFGEKFRHSKAAKKAAKSQKSRLLGMSKSSVEMNYHFDKDKANREVESFRRGGEEAHLVWMKPITFLARVPCPSTTLISAALPVYQGDYRGFDRQSLKKIESRIRKGKELDPLFLDYNRMWQGYPSHEGRHRSVVAYRLGIEQVPVIVVGSEDKERKPLGNSNGNDIRIEVEGNAFRFYKDGEYIGFAQRTKESFVREDSFYIARFSVFEEGRGYGTRCMQDLVEYARKHGFNAVVFIAEHPAMQKIAKKLGFRKLGSMGDDPIMKLELKA